MNNKKGNVLVQTTLAKIIITLIVLMLLLTVVYVWQKEVTGGVDSKKCKLEVTRVSYASKVPGMKDKYLTAYCPLIDWGILKLDGQNEMRKLAINLVEEMVDCWDKFGEGELNPIKGEIEEQKTHCFICTSFRMPETLSKEEWGKFGNELRIVLFNNDKARKFLSNTITNQRINREEYNAKEIEVDNNKIGKDKITYTYFPEFQLQPDKTYYLTNVFVVNKQSFVTTTLQEGAPLNEYETISNLMFVEESNFENVCEQLEN